MRRRWIIRGFFIGLLLLAMTAWAWSYFYCEEVWHLGSGARKEYAASLFRGELFFREVGGRGSAEGWAFRHASFAEVDGTDFESNLRVAGEFRVLGFYFENDLPIVFFVGMPVWFPTIGWAGITWLLWQRTRVMEKGRAFPVEVGKADTRNLK